VSTSHDSKKQGSSKSKQRQLKTEELDQVAGGTTSPPPPPNWNQIAGFDTSHINLDAASMQAGTTEQQVAQVVGSNQGTEAGAMHLLEAAAQYDSTSVSAAC
jgi:hypothetical protein